MAFRIHMLSLIFILGVLLCGGNAQFPVPNARVVARWTNNLYYAGKVDSTGNGRINVLFDDSHRITHSIRDLSAVIADEAPNDVRMGQHVLATWKGGEIYYIGFVTTTNYRGRFKVTFDDNDEDYYSARELRLFPDHISPYEVGARVFARWTDEFYYRGFVTVATASRVRIEYDNGNAITLNRDDAVILDKIPCFSEVHAGQRVIGFQRGTTKYYPGWVTRVMDCCYAAVYHVRFDDDDQRYEDFNQIRFLV